MAKQIILENLLGQLDEYENEHALWCAKLTKNGRQALQFVSNNIDSDELINLTNSFIKFVSLFAQCKPNSSPDKKNSIQNEQNIEQKDSQDLIPKDNIIKMMNNDLQCPICNEWLLRATSAKCGHTFCETCIKKWLNINNTCPVCRTSIQYISTSLAVDNFISNLCQLFGGDIKERRESVQKSQMDHMNNTNGDIPVPRQIETYSVYSSYESLDEETYRRAYAQMMSPNVATLVPLSTPFSHESINLRQPIVGSNTYYLNTFQSSSSSPTSSTTSTRNNHNETPSTSVISPQVNRNQPSSSVNSPRINRNQSSSTSVNSPRVNRNQSSSTSVNSPRVNRNQTSSTSVNSPRVNRNQTSSTSVNSPRVNRNQTSSTSVNSPRVNRNQTSSTSVNSPRYNRNQTSSTSVNSPHVNRNQTSSTSVNSPHVNHNQTSTSVNSPRVNRNQPVSSSMTTPRVNHSRPSTPIVTTMSNRRRSNTNIRSLRRCNHNMAILVPLNSSSP